MRRMITGAVAMMALTVAQQRRRPRIVSGAKALADPPRNRARIRQAEERTRATVLAMGVEGAAEA